MGTRFLCTEESPIHHRIKEQIVAAGERDTELIFRPLQNTARVASNSVSRKVVEILDDGGAFEDVRDLVAGSRGRKVFDEGDPDLGIWSSGMVQGLIRDIPSVSTMVGRVVSEAEELISDRLGSAIRAG